MSLATQGKGPGPGQEQGQGQGQEQGQGREPRSRRVLLGTGLRYHLLEWGHDDPSLTHTVVLVHGFLDFAWGWEALVQAGLAGRYHVVALDLRGHGDTDRVGAGGYYHFFDYLADLDEVVRHVARERVSLVGHSMGGSVTAYFTGTFPDRVHRLALLEGLGAHAEPLSAVPGRIERWLTACRRVREAPPRTMASLTEAADRLCRHDPHLPKDRALRLAELGTSTDTDGRRSFKHDPLHLTSGPYPFLLEAAEALWRRTTCPVLLVDADQSEFQAFADEIARRAACFPDARRALLRDAGHMMQRHQPEALARLLIEFLG